MVSQKDYYESFQKLNDKHNSDIQYFKTNLPNSSICTLFLISMFLMKNLTPAIGLLTLMNYYSNLSMSTSTSDTTKQGEFFLALFKNLRYYDEQGVLFPT